MKSQPAIFPPVSQYDPQINRYLPYFIGISDEDAIYLCAVDNFSQPMSCFRENAFNPWSAQ